MPPQTEQQLERQLDGVIHHLKKARARVEQLIQQEEDLNEQLVQVRQAGLEESQS